MKKSEGRLSVEDRVKRLIGQIAILGPINRWKDIDFYLTESIQQAVDEARAEGITQERATNSGAVKSAISWENGYDDGFSECQERAAMIADLATGANGRQIAKDIRALQPDAKEKA